MQYRQLGNSELEVPVIAFGAWAIGGWMWGGTDDEDAIRALHVAIDHGITAVDTAAIYGMGHSEQVVGKALSGRRDKVVLATKCGLRWNLEEGELAFESSDNEGNPVKIYKNLKPDSIQYECEESLKRLNTDYIDLYQCHWPDATTDLDDTMDALLKLKEAGKIRAIGVSNFSVDMMKKCMAKGELASDQPKYNALDRGIEEGVLPFCHENGIGVLAYSPIAQGLLTGKVTMDREFAEGDHRRNSPLFSRENRRKILDMLETVKPAADRHDATLAQLFLAWTVAQPGLTAALAGARNEKQAQENAAAGDITLTADECRFIREQVEAVDLS
jgi:methylglyoxal reductase